MTENCWLGHKESKQTRHNQINSQIYNDYGEYLRGNIGDTIVTISGLFLFCLFVCFVALHPKSTAMVMVGRSVHLTTLFSGQA